MLCLGWEGMFDQMSDTLSTKKCLTELARDKGSPCEGRGSCFCSGQIVK